MKIHQLITAACLLLTACGNPTLPKSQPTEEAVQLFPDYADVTIPVNVAPLNFMLKTEHDDAYVRLQPQSGGEALILQEKEGQFTWPEKKWRQLLSQSAGQTLEIQVYAHHKTWKAYPPFQWHVAEEPMDGYLAYRLIEPGYELWGQMGIYQRCLGNYKQNALIENKQTEQNCMNCHSFCMQQPDRMLFHMREKLAGTYLLCDGKMEKLDTKTEQNISPLVYPSWHPSGRFVAFSVNTTRQDFHTNHKNRIEVFDTESDVVVYDVEQHVILTTPLLKSPQAFETFPTFSPDGRTLYFCTAQACEMPQSYDHLHYSLCSVAFDPDKGSFGQQVDTLYHASDAGKSVSFPRVSPDGRFLMITLSGYGNFSIWHKDADLYLIDLQNRSLHPLEQANSEDVESYHSWSSNSRWVVFSSRRLDGLYTRPFFAYVNHKGEVSKPFLLPQEKCDFYDRCMKSFNIPEFIKGPVQINSYELATFAKKTTGIKLKNK
ncbi:MAG: hypothetical protein ACI30I_05600 [Parabacteroides sp.]